MGAMDDMLANIQGNNMPQRSGGRMDAMLAGITQPLAPASPPEEKSFISTALDYLDKPASAVAGAVEYLAGQSDQDNILSAAYEGARRNKDYSRVLQAAGVDPESFGGKVANIGGKILLDPLWVLTPAKAVEAAARGARATGIADKVADIGRAVADSSVGRKVADVAERAGNTQWGDYTLKRWFTEEGPLDAEKKILQRAPVLEGELSEKVSKAPEEARKAINDYIKAVPDIGRFAPNTKAAENYFRGLKAMDEVISNQIDMLNAIYQPEIGDISFLWGTPGRGPKYKGGSGVSHIIARRASEGEDGQEIARKMVDVLDKGKAGEKYGPPKWERVNVNRDGHTAVVSLHKDEIPHNWLLTGWKDGEKVSGGVGGVHVPANPTHSGPILNRSGVGADTFLRPNISQYKEKVNALVDEALNNKQLQAQLSLGKIDNGLAARIKDKLNLDVSNLQHVVDTDFVRHAIKRHGDEAIEAADNQMAVTADDLKRIPEILGSPDDVKWGKRGETKSIIYEKRVNGSIYYVELVGKKKGILLSKSMWKKPSSADHAGRISDPHHTSTSAGLRPNPVHGMASSTSNVQQTAANVKAGLPGVTRSQVLQEARDAGMGEKLVNQILRTKTIWKKPSVGTDAQGLRPAPGSITSEAKPQHNSLASSDPRISSGKSGVNTSGMPDATRSQVLQKARDAGMEEKLVNQIYELGEKAAELNARYTDELAKRGIIPAETAEKFAGGRDILREYRKYVSPEEHLRILRETGQNAEAVKFERELDKLQKYVDSKGYKLNLKAISPRQVLPPEIQQKIGRILDATHPLARAGQISADLINKYDFLESVANKYAKADVKGLPGAWRQMAGKAYGPLEGLYVPAGVYDEVSATVRRLTEPEKFWRKAVSYWKMGKTILNPAVYSKNFIVNAILLNVGGVPLQEVPVYLARAAKEIASKGAAFREAREADSFLLNPSAKNELAQLDLARATVLQRGLQGAADIYKGNERIGKMAAYLWAKDKGRTAEEAAKFADTVLFDYSKVPPVIDFLQRSGGVPFASFPYFVATKTLPDVLYNNPAKLMKYYRPIQMTQDPDE